MIKLLFTGALSLLITGLAAQEKLGQNATLNEDGTINIEQVSLPESLLEKNRQADLLFSFGEPANPQIKNSRGVTIADVDNDGVDEILYGIDTKLYALEGDGTILWEKDVLGPILLPPSAMDIDGDGNIEIAVNTGYPTTVGRLYLLDNQGEDLPGWPLNFDDKWMINAPVFADLDQDGAIDIISCRRVGSTEGYVHAIKQDGTPLNANWPVQFDATPAFTPSVGDINNDGTNEVIIATSSTGMYAYDANGQLLDGFPLVDAARRYSYQSPILVDLDGDENLEIVGSNHGDSPGFYVLNSDATYADGWPIATAGWTYSTPTVLDTDEDGTYEIFMADRNTSNDGTPLPVIYGLSPDGSNLDDFPIEKYGGNEGVLSIADINNDDVLDIIFSSTLTDEDGFGYIHAYSLDGSGELEDFPLRPRGFTFLNGAVVGDVDNDGMMDLTANSYTQTFGAGIDSTYVSVYNLNVPYDESKIKRNGYKGSNSRQGLVGEEAPLGVNETALAQLSISPNPSNGTLRIALPINVSNARLTIRAVDGKEILAEERSFTENETVTYELGAAQAGLYFITVSHGKSSFTAKWVKK